VARRAKRAASFEEIAGSGAAGSAGLISRILASRFLVLLGNASYAIYILQFPVWLWWNHYSRVVYKMEWPPMLDFALYLSSLMAISIVTMILLERPARNYFRPRWDLAVSTDETSGRQGAI
jgi:peptidoglycan/LPS O-acetylase OafA/YrhL